MRGKRRRRNTLRRNRWSIPACAGEAPAQPTTERTSPVYPRVCGGSRQPNPVEHRYRGLSPRVRGKLRRVGGQRHNGLVYPRVCGGSIPCIALIALFPGLSPRVRGKRHPTDASYQCYRSIPACAGEATSALSSASASWVYPRVCGGSLAHRNRPSVPPGLSPRVRGKQRQRPPTLLAPGSIPACAGEARGPGRVVGVVAVYPRVCGGSRVSVPQPCWPQGLSPRVRGKLELQHKVGVHPRSIPACAGEASPIFILLV